jgi:hypothetical protein
VLTGFPAALVAAYDASMRHHHAVVRSASYPVEKEWLQGEHRSAKPASCRFIRSHTSSSATAPAVRVRWPQQSPYDAKQYALAVPTPRVG